MSESMPASPSAPLSVFIMGAGVVGTTLAGCFVRAGVPVAGLHGRQAQSLDGAGAVVPGVPAIPMLGVPSTTGDVPHSLSQVDVVLIAVRDDRIKDVVDRLVREKRLRETQVVLHASGAHPARDILAAARPHVRAVGTMHPLVSFADPGLLTAGLRGVAFGIEGDPMAVLVAGRLVAQLDGRPVTLDGKDLPLYHAAAVLASNFVVALAELARGLLVDAGVPAAEALPVLVPLMASVVQNLAQVGLPAALTGPVERGDVSSVERHLHILGARAPQIVDLYQRLGREVLRIALQKGPLPEDAVGRFEDLFGRTAGGGRGSD